MYRRIVVPGRDLSRLEKIFQTPMTSATLYVEDKADTKAKSLPILPQPIQDWIAKYVDEDDAVSFVELVRHKTTLPFEQTVFTDEMFLSLVTNSVLLREWERPVRQILNNVMHRRSLKFARMYFMDRMQPILEHRSVSKSHINTKWKRFCGFAGGSKWATDILIALYIFFGLGCVAPEGSEESVKRKHTTVLIKKNAHLADPITLSEEERQTVLSRSHKIDRDVAFCLAVQLQLLHPCTQGTNKQEDELKSALKALWNNEPLTFSSMWRPSLKREWCILSFMSNWRSMTSLLLPAAFHHMQDMADVLLVGKVTFTEYEEGKPVLILRHSSDFTKMAEVVSETCTTHNMAPFSLTANRIKLRMSSTDAEFAQLKKETENRYCPVVVTVCFYRWRRGASTTQGFFVKLKKVIL